MNHPEHWETGEADGRCILRLTARGEDGPVRRPTSAAILQSITVTSFELTVEARSVSGEKKWGSMLIYFGYQDSLRFYYAHFGQISDRNHNIIGLVNNADRVNINKTVADSDAARLTPFEWHALKVTYCAETGRIESFIDDMKNPIHSLVDDTFRHGKVGIGSFYDFGDFRNFHLKYDLYEREA